ncbi:MAG: putative transport system permease protein [Actinomycetota bacterium]|nr:putative transport system permease protein [Actinomycetota bacterium]
MGGLSWVAALLRRRPLRILGAATGVALAVALLGSIGAFLGAAKADMTHRAVAQVAVDWQVEAQPGSDPAAVLSGVRAQHGVRQAVPVGMATTDGLEAVVGGTTQTTGSGAVVGLPAGYRVIFPGAIRTLAGSGEGVLLAQQTAANLHAAPGDTINVNRSGMAPVAVRVDGVVDLPQIDSLFQRVGAPAGAQAQAPPDNVVLLPLDAWHAAFDPLAASRPDLVRQQVHVRLDRSLPSDPSTAFTRVTGMAHRLEADLTGTGLVGDNLAATLDAARSDALYAQVLFVLLGLPGAVLAGLLTWAVAAASRGRRRREFALLRVRGASLATVQRLALAEALGVAVVGAVVGLAGAAVVGRFAFGSATLGTTRGAALAWAGAACVAGVAIAATAVALPARRDARQSIAVARRRVGRAGLPMPLRMGLDLFLLAGAGLVFWATSRGHYALVLAPEGVPTVSVSYWALAGPLLLWAGAGLFAWRVSEAVLGRGRVVRAAVRPLAGRLAGPAASSLRRQRGALAGAIVLVTLSFAFAISTSVFNSTYRQQAEIDALLTNGAPVTVTAAPGRGLDAAAQQRVAHVSGVRRVEPVQHRYVYVGADLQDLYGVRPQTIGAAGKIQDAYVSGGTATSLLQTLARQPDAALVSAETVLDFQLHPGDHLRLRVRDARTGALTEVLFQFAGVVKEFPTAPRDSFIVANASYIASRTGDATAEVLLVDPANSSPRAVAGRVRTVVGSTAKVSDISASRRVVGSSLTAVDLAGLTRVELAYALVLATAGAGLVLGLGLAERRRGFAIAAALGARPAQLAAFARSEAAALAVLGGGMGVVAGWALSQVLVKVLTGVFDPPPATLAVPWTYLAALAALAAAALVVVTRLAVRSSRTPTVALLRDL